MKKKKPRQKKRKKVTALGIFIRIDLFLHRKAVSI